MNRVLLVEDDEHLAEGLAFNLRNSGYEVELATTGERGLEAALAELSVPEVRRLLEIALPLPPASVELKLAWSRWRRARPRWTPTSTPPTRGPACWP